MIRHGGSGDERTIDTGGVGIKGRQIRYGMRLLPRYLITILCEKLEVNIE